MDSEESRLDRIERIVEQLSQELRQNAQEMRQNAQKAYENDERRAIEFKTEMDKRDKKFRQEMDERDKKFKQERDERDKKFQQKMDERDSKWRQEQIEQDARFEKEHKKLTKQLGDWGVGFGRFTEGLAFASIERILKEQFGVDEIETNETHEKNGEAIEIDVLGICNGKNPKLIIVEIKSHLRENSIHQIQNTLKKIPYFYPHYKNYTLVGLIVCVAGPKNLKQKTIKQGISLAIVKNNKLFELIKAS